MKPSLHDDAWYTEYNGTHFVAMTHILMEWESLFTMITLHKTQQRWHVNMGPNACETHSYSLLFLSHDMHWLKYDLRRYHVIRYELYVELNMVAIYCRATNFMWFVAPTQLLYISSPLPLCWEDQQLSLLCLSGSQKSSHAQLGAS